MSSKYSHCTTPGSGTQTLQKKRQSIEVRTAYHNSQSNPSRHQKLNNGKSIEGSCSCKPFRSCPCPGPISLESLRVRVMPWPTLAATLSATNGLRHFLCHVSAPPRTSQVNSSNALTEHAGSRLRGNSLNGSTKSKYFNVPWSSFRRSCSKQSHGHSAASRACTFSFQHAVVYCLLYLILLVPKPCHGALDITGDFRCPETCKYKTPELPTFDEFCSRPQPRAETATTRAPRGERSIDGPPTDGPSLAVDKPISFPVAQLKGQFKELTRKPPRLRAREGSTSTPPSSTAGTGDSPAGPDISSTTVDKLPLPPSSRSLKKDTMTEANEEDAASKNSTSITRLRICEHISPEMLLDPKKFCNSTLEERKEIWNRLWDEDRKACDTVCQMEKLFDRFDCNLRYSVRWSCRHCQDAYREWTCAMRLPIFHPMTGELWKPCRSLCTDVEERCPHFHPIQGEAYAGEPLFYCIDPNIPEPENSSLYSPDKRCYLACWLRADLRARIPVTVNNTDSLPVNKEETSQTSSKASDKDDIEPTPAIESGATNDTDANTESVDGDNVIAEHERCPAIDELQNEALLERISPGSQSSQSVSSAAESFTQATVTPSMKTCYTLYVVTILLWRAPPSGRSLFCAFCTVVSVVLFSCNFSLNCCFHSATT